MQRTFFLSSSLFVSAIVCIGAGAQAIAVTPAKAPKAAAEAPAAASSNIAYDDLHKYVGDRVSVHTKFQTTRTGVLAKVTKSELTLNIDTPSGQTQMTIPKDTVADVVALPAPAQH